MREKLRVALIAGPIPYCISLANALMPKCEVHLFVGERDALNYGKDSFGLLDKSIYLHKYKEFRRRDPRRFYSDLLLMLALRKLHPAIVHQQSSGTIGMMLFFPLLSKSKFILTLHDPRQHLGIEGLFKMYEDVSQKFFIRSAKAVIVHGNTMLKELHLRYGSYIPGVNLPHGDLSLYNAFNRKITPELCNRNAKPAVLFFGRFMKYKGIDYLVKAIPLVREQIPDAQFWIIGSGDDSFKKQLYDSTNVFIRNEYIPHSEVGGIFFQADVVVLPYLEASQTGIIPIAYAYGKPVIASNVGGLPDVVIHGKTGLLVEPANESQLALSIIAILKDDKLRIAMGDNAKQFCDAELSWTSIAEKTLEVYCSVLNE